MPKRSLHQPNKDAKKIEQLNQAVEAMLVRVKDLLPRKI